MDHDILHLGQFVAPGHKNSNGEANRKILLRNIAEQRAKAITITWINFICDWLMNIR